MIRDSARDIIAFEISRLQRIGIPLDALRLQSIQLERGLRIVDSPGVIFEDDDSIQGQKESSVLLRNVVKTEDVDDPISVGGCASSPCSSSRSHLRIVTS